MERMKITIKWLIVYGLFLTLSAICLAQPTPTLDTTPPVNPPEAAGLVRLFDGTPESLAKNWLQGGKPAQWKIENGAIVSTKSDIVTKENYTDFQLHVEFRVPYMPTKKGQERGNSGVYLQSRYEIQILDSYGFKEPGTGDCGAVYHQAAPLVNACKPPLQWQTYDISFRAARFDPTTHAMTEQPRVTVIQNGLVVQNDQIINGPTHIVKPTKPKVPADPSKPAVPTSAAIDESRPGPIRLQYHGNTVAFRNIWIIPLPTQPVTHYEPK